MTFDWRGYINLGKADLREVVRAAYDLSSPQGLGFLHARDGGLSDEEVDRIVDRESRTGTAPIVAGMDYVNGRSVKMHVTLNPETGDLYIGRSWYDHGRGALEELLGRFGISPDAIDKADRQAAEAHQEWKADQAEKAKKAAAWLREHGGKVLNPAISREPMDEEIYAGLHAATDAGLCRYDFETREYILTDPAAELGS